ncbi:uncharacterized protein EI97DRAFT_498301 [Westerdykella ornata]|uniref:Altered inheritance of mitochondria protein 6 n=1 Tax=Westerdykella ornata TaxID=318751 RepID=A0A6A6JYA8_WESOR|nr:uncharacterized protein EI97DRAFT_498301 [Westerdykella ornata]KAF2280009.1 hypothetical protein EI97DRAFT_498301 [Westerdykella ornata]
MHYIPELICLSLAISGASAAAIPDVSSTLQNVLKNTDRSNSYRYPTDFTRGIVPKAIHSHNDYWRDVPFYTALSYGAISIEADVWLINGTLYVGHDTSSLTPTRTLQSLYLDPLLSTLHLLNPPPTSPFTTSPTKRGLFDTSPSQPLYLHIDLKTPGPTTWPAVLAALQPLRAHGYLTTYNLTSGTWTDSAITVIGTGNTPLDLVRGAQGVRDAFWDAPLALLNSSLYADVTRFEAPVASTDLIEAVGEIRGLEGLGERQRRVVQEQVGWARERGMLARYWNAPAWPVKVRNAVWKGLWEGGVGLLGVDDLQGGAVSYMGLMERVGCERECCS